MTHSEFNQLAETHRTKANARLVAQFFEETLIQDPTHEHFLQWVSDKELFNATIRNLRQGE